MSMTTIKTQIESRKKALYIIIGLLTVLMLTVLYLYGLLGVAAIAALLLFIAITPLLASRYHFILFVWLFIVPVFDSFRELLIQGTNPAVFLLTGLSMPFALLLICREFKTVIKYLPFMGFLIGFDIILFLNILRPDADKNAILEFLKLFMEIFVVFCSFQFFSKCNPQKLFNQINIFISLNSLVALAQRVTGIGLMVIEGIPRPAGFLGHPNVLGFLNVIYLPFGIYQVLNAKTTERRIFWLTGVILSIIAIMVAMTKSVIIAMLFQFLVLFLFLPKKIKIYCILGLLVFSGILLCTNYLFSLKLQEYFANRLNNTDSWEWRIKIWRFLLTDIDYSNILLGHGTDAAQTRLMGINYGQPFFVHNVYLQLVYEFGISSVFFILALLQPVKNYLYEIYKRPVKEKLNYIFPCLILSAIFFNMAADNSVFLRTPMMFAWLLLTYFYMLLTHKLKQDGAKDF